MKIFRSHGALISVAIGAAFLVLIGLRVLQGSRPQEAAPTVEELRAERGVPVTLARATRGPLQVWREFDGNASAVRDAVVRARSDDQISDVLVSVGDHVRAGQLLVRSADQSTQAQLRQAELSADQARRNVDRLRRLHEAGALSDQDWEDAVMQLELREADLEVARDALALTSPLSGVVTEVVARPGMIPSAGDPLVRVADLSSYIVYLRVSAGEAAAIRDGQRAQIAASGAQGRVRRVALQADPASRLVEVEVEFPPDADLIIGTLTKVRVLTANVDDAIQVPRAAVSNGEVWVVDQSGTASRRAVDIGATGSETVQVVGGLRPGEQVVVSGGSLLSEGARVRIVDSPGAGE